MLGCNCKNGKKCEIKVSLLKFPLHKQNYVLRMHFPRAKYKKKCIVHSNPGPVRYILFRRSLIKIVVAGQHLKAKSRAYGFIGFICNELLANISIVYAYKTIITTPSNTVVGEHLYISIKEIFSPDTWSSDEIVIFSGVVCRAYRILFSF